MKIASICILALAGVCVFAGCRQQDVRKVTISVPELHNKACAQIVGDALSRQMGVQRETINFDLSSRKVEVSYDSLLLAKKNIEFTIADAGFSANEVPANADAASKLPAECRM